MNKSNDLSTPIAVIVAGFMVASAIYLSAGSGTALIKQNNNGTKAEDSGATARDIGTDSQVKPAKSPAGGTYEVSVDDDPVLGDPEAPVTLIEFGDYRCPFCLRFWKNTLPTIKKDYVETGKVKIVYRDLSIHPPQSDIAAEASHCANEQDKFWQFQDRIFEGLDSGETFTAGVMKEYAGELGLNQGAFDSCLESEKYAEEHKKDGSDARAVTATGTPTTFIGLSTDDGVIQGEKIVGAQPTQTFISAIDTILGKVE